MRLRPILAAVTLAAGLTLTAACGDNSGTDPYAHCYDANGNYDDDIAGCPDDDIHIPTYKAPKPRASVHRTTARPTPRRTTANARATRSR